MFDKSHLEQLRKKMREDGLKAYLVTTGDPHDSEGPAEYWLAERQYFCPFTGENAYFLCTLEEAFLYCDGRFFVAAKKQLEGSTIKMMKMDTPGYPSLHELIKEKDLYPIGVNYLVNSPSFADSLGMSVDVDYSSLVEDRPALPYEPIRRFDMEGLNTLTRDEKIENVRKELSDKGDKAVLITTLDDIAWILNLRGNDIECTPTFYSYLYISMDEVVLFVEPGRIDFDLGQVQVRPYEDIESFLRERSEIRTLADGGRCNKRLYSILHNVHDSVVPSTIMKAIKGSVEIENTKSIQAEDGVAMLKFIKYLEEHKAERLSEWDYAKVLNGYRAEGKRFMELSFPTIAAFGSNAAMMHYGPSEEVHDFYEGQVELLVDSGGQYYGGTTDTTRTFLMGEPTEEFVHDYTLTLKSVIALSKSIFLEGTPGVCIDYSAREIMWREGLDYKCGTGHGVGYCSNVHEGPNSFRPRIRKGGQATAIVPGMITTVEPGVYKAGKYGIRIENNLLTVLDRTTPDGTFYRFETITYVPIDTRPLDLSIMSQEEIDWLNQYHQIVFDKLSPLVEGELLEFLKEKTKPVSK